MTKTFAVIDANSAYWTPEGETDYERATFVQAGSPAEACAKAREEGFDGLLIASQQDATKPGSPGALKGKTMSITWTASNNSSFLNGCREASSIAAAVRAARRYIRYELYGEGKATIFEDGNPVRQDECSIHTKYRWETRTDF